MLSRSILTGLFGLALCANAQTEAPIVTDNCPTDLYHSQLQIKHNSTVRGYIEAWTDSPIGMDFRVVLKGIEGHESLLYHIHEHPVPEDGNCYATGAHLDPYGRGENPPCDIGNPATCQVGDLSGKHGPAFAPDDTQFIAEFRDYFLSNVPGSPAYFGDRSWVVHAPDKTRLNCGNFKKIVPGDDGK
ncbi:predicted protein [Aspergillus terreus NIH2624]|uniref:superoxide dismutase n=1 Tax=Aspergillus terreus (strain NIH 2624 / FGSC A1156) TaxID=341663 RepID=Q0D128_ASPTN|nr:uncharacterized protein ATEG_00356 [Aspergillus terreus NIH2624]EAU39002.1 predicted protein [Aspergillus terreus NIH2624]